MPCSTCGNSFVVFTISNSRARHGTRTATATSDLLVVEQTRRQAAAAVEVLHAEAFAAKALCEGDKPHAVDDVVVVVREEKAVGRLGKRK